MIYASLEICIFCQIIKVTKAKSDLGYTYNSLKIIPKQFEKIKELFLPFALSFVRMIPFSFS
jgi:hypothetical protein